MTSRIAFNYPTIAKSTLPMQANPNGISIHVTKTSYGPGIRQQYNRTWRRTSSKNTNINIRPSSFMTRVIPELKCTSVRGDVESTEQLPRTGPMIFTQVVTAEQFRGLLRVFHHESSPPRFLFGFWMASLMALSLSLMPSFNFSHSVRFNLLLNSR